jgi:hypothetical protein
VGTKALWISSTTGRQLTKKNLGTLISNITREIVGVDVSPHLFRTAGASTSALLVGELPHLGSALLGHSDPRITEEHYRRVSSIQAAKTYSSIIKGLSTSVDIGRDKVRVLIAHLERRFADVRFTPKADMCGAMRDVR